MREENIGRLVEQWTGTMEGMGIEQDERDRNFEGKQKSRQGNRFCRRYGSIVMNFIRKNV